MLITDDSDNASYPVSGKFAELLKVGTAMIWDDIMDVIIEYHKQGKPEETLFFNDLPPMLKSKMNTRLCFNFLHALDLLIFKIFSPTPMRLGCTAEELLLHWMVRNAKICVEEETPKIKNRIEKGLNDYLESVLEDKDYLYLFDPKFDGVDDLEELGTQSLKFKDLFKPFNKDRLTHPMILPNSN
jgi:hypothetical protein